MTPELAEEERRFLQDRHLRRVEGILGHHGQQHCVYVCVRCGARRYIQDTRVGANSHHAAIRWARDTHPGECTPKPRAPRRQTPRPPAPQCAGQLTLLGEVEP